MKFVETDRLPIVYCDAWEETKRRWEKEGMTDYDEEMNIFDGPIQSCWLYGPYQDPIPAFEERVLAEDETHVKVQNPRGQIEIRAKQGTSMPFFAEYPIKSRADWDGYKYRFDPGSPGRYPDNWEQLVGERETKDSGEIRGVAV